MIGCVSELEVSHCPAFSTNFGETGSVSVDSKNHVADVVANASVGVLSSWYMPHLSLPVFHLIAVRISRSGW
jgi:hypothetical protein